MEKHAYFVVGGEYTDSQFTALSNHGEEERYGPFSSYKEAREIWSQHAWRTVDQCYARYLIIDAGGTPVDDPPTDDPSS